MISCHILNWKGIPYPLLDCINERKTRKTDIRQTDWQHREHRAAQGSCCHNSGQKESGEDTCRCPRCRVTPARNGGWVWMAGSGPAAPSHNPQVFPRCGRIPAHGLSCRHGSTCTPKQAPVEAGPSCLAICGGLHHCPLNACLSTCCHGHGHMRRHSLQIE